MFQVFRRIGFFRRRWVWVLLLFAGVSLAGYWMVPWRGAGAQLQLFAMRADGTFAQRVPGVPAAAVASGGADTAAIAGAAGRRGVPLVLAVANAGMRPGRPERLVLSLPRWYRLVAPPPHVRTEILPDEPLQRLVVETDFPVVQAGRVPTLLPGIDTLWIEPWVPDYWCTADADSVPQLIASTAPDTAGVVPLQIYWSFEGAELEDRQTGLLTVELPGELFRRNAEVDIAASPVQVQLPSAPRPELGGLVEGGTRHAECGPPGDPMRIFTALWLTGSGGRMISVHYGGLPRKEYYDLNGDSIIELEMWDPDGDGNMEAWRSLRLPIPEYMLPAAPLAVADSAIADSLRADSAGTLAQAGVPLPALAGSDLASLGRLLFPGDITRARQLFVRRAPPPRPVIDDDDGPLGVPLGEAPPAVTPPQPEPVGEPEPAPELAPPPDEEDAPEDEPDDLIERAIQEAAEREQEGQEQPED